MATNTVDRLIEAARYIEQHAHERLTLAVLGEQASMSPSRFQRVFKAAFGISPKAYQDGVRMGLLKQSLRAGNGVTQAIYDAGFGSISRVYGEASRNLGMKPTTYRAGGEGEEIVYACRATALGPMMLAATASGVCFAQFDDDEAALYSRLEAEFPKASLRASPAGQSPLLDRWIESIDCHISAGAPRPDLPLDMRGTAFQIKVWQFLMQVPRGQVLSYGELAQRVGHPKAVRAVASACARNRIAVLIPCHRVLRGDGGLGGYRWGLDRKRALIVSEREENA
ncbi:MAG: methylated-DNA--[protein]-cysteine S-methyltransferase [Oceanospirillales bacterium]|nr:methylated-DNA--[protein]-cysteine S-methyltransferase [Oceanospirillales bacterium]